MPVCRNVFALRGWLVAVSYGFVLSALAGSSKAQDTEKARPAVAQQIEQRDRLVTETKKHVEAAEYDAAIVKCRQVLQLQESIGDDADIDLVAIHAWLTQICISAERFEDAVVSAEKTLQIQTDTRGAEAWQTASARFELDYIQRLAKADPKVQRDLLTIEKTAQQLAEEQKFAAAAEMILRLVPLEKELLGALHPDLSHTYAFASAHWLHADQPEKGLTTAEACLSIRLASLGANHPDTAAAHFAVAKCVEKTQDWSSAINHFSTALESYRTLGMPGDVARCHSSMGACWREKRDRESASRAYESAARKFEEANQPEEAGESRWEFGKELLELEQYGTAAQEFQQARQRYQEAENAASAAWLLVWRGDALVEEPDDDEAISAYSLASREFSTLQIDDGIARSNMSLGKVLIRLKRFDEARTSLVAADAAYKSMQDDDGLKSVQLTLSDIYTAWYEDAVQGNDIEKARSVLEDSLAFQRQQPGPNNQKVAGTLMQLAWVFERGLKDFEAAKNTHQERLNVLTELVGPDHPQIADARFAIRHVTLLAALTPEELALRDNALLFAEHAAELFREGNFTEAKAKLESSIEIDHSLLGDESPDYAANLGTLAFMHKQMGEYAKAEPLYVRVTELTRLQRGETHPSYATTLRDLGDFYLTTAKLTAATETLRTAVGVYENADVSGFAHEQAVKYLVDALQSLSQEHLMQGSVESARKNLQEVFELQMSAHGEQDWRTIEARVAIAGLVNFESSEEILASLKEARKNFDPRTNTESASLPAIQRALTILGQVFGEQHPEYLVTLIHLGVAQSKLAQWEAAERTFEEASRLAEKLYGPQHPYGAAALLNRATMLSMQGKHRDAKRLAQQAESIFLATMGDRSESLLNSVVTLGAACQDIGEFMQALQHFERALQLNQSIIAAGEQDDMFGLLDYEAEASAGRNPNHLRILRGLAQANEQLGNLPEAVTYCTRIRELLQPATGNPTEEYAISTANLAGVCLAMNDYQQAESLYHEALALETQIHRPENPGNPAIWNNIGRVYFMMGQLSKAVDAYRRAISILREESGFESSRSYCVCLDNLALALVSSDSYPEAEQLYRDAIRLKKTAYGEDHAIFAVSLMNLGDMYRELGRMSEARDLLEHACRIMEPQLGTEHREYRNALFSLGKLYWQEGDSTEAEECLFQLLTSARNEISANAVVQSERQQFASIRGLRYQLDLYVSLMSESGSDPERTYEQILAWKGSVLRRQRRVREFRQDPEFLQQATMLRRTRNEAGHMIMIMQFASTKFDRLDHVNSRITRLALGLPSEVESEEQRVQFLHLLVENKEQLERELAVTVNGLKSHVGQNWNPIRPNDLRGCLPPESALVDFFEYTHTTPPKNGEKTWNTERRFVAMIIRNDQPIRRIDLGSSERLKHAVDAWLAAVANGDADEAGIELRRLIWLPICQELHDTKLLFVSPDGPLAKIPFAAIPGSQPGRFLIQDIAIVNVASAQLLPEVIANTLEPEPLPRRVLVVGGVDYDQAAEPAAVDTANVALPVRSGDVFAPLAGTKAELDAIEGLYSTHFGSEGLLCLQGDEATEDNFRLQAPNYPVLHLGTHGFFASSRFQAALNASVARDASRESQSSESLDDYYPGLLSGIALAGANHPRPDLGDGILTAEEVAALDLSRVDLTVLSACETGLGIRAAGGEGLMSLQRAFQIAGSRTVISTLWKVPDKGTQALMSEFYRNLWGKKMGKLEALRQAQISMLQGYDPASGTIQSRGATISGPSDRHDSARPVTPYYWGAFVLSGDWR